MLCLVVLGVFRLVSRSADEKLGAALPNQTSKTENIQVNGILLNATTTAGNPSRHATSTATLINGAKKITLQFIVKATSTVSQSDFLVYVSADTASSDGNGASGGYSSYQRFTDLVVLNGTSSPSTANEYYQRRGVNGIQVPTLAAKGATTTVALDLTYGTWRSMICVASSSPHSESTCKVLIEY